MQADVRNAESDVLNYLYKNIDAQSFKFNQLQAVVIPTTSKTVVTGSPYQANVVLAAFPIPPSARKSQSGRPLWYPLPQVTENIPRTPENPIYCRSGKIDYTAPDGSIRAYNFSSEYEVIPPVLIASPTKMNAFYKGVDNPLLIGAGGASAKDITVNMTNADITKVTDYQYIVRPKKVPKEAVLTVTATINGKRKRMHPRNTDCLECLDPTPKVGGKNGYKDPENELQAQTGVIAELENFSFDMKFEVVDSSKHFIQRQLVQKNLPITRFLRLTRKN